MSVSVMCTSNAQPMEISKDIPLIRQKTGIDLKRSKEVCEMDDYTCSRILVDYD